VEQVGDVTDAAKLGPAVLGIEQIDRDESGPALVIWSLPRQSDDLPVIEARQELDDAPADDATGPGDEGDLLLHVPLPLPLAHRSTVKYELGHDPTGRRILSYP